jgi:hypothetical protein
MNLFISTYLYIEVDGLAGEGLEVVTSVGSGPGLKVRGASGSSSPLMEDIDIRQRRNIWTEKFSMNNLEGI